MSFSSVESCRGFVSIDKTIFQTAGPSVGSAAYMEDSFPRYPDILVKDTLVMDVLVTDILVTGHFGNWTFC